MLLGSKRVTDEDQDQNWCVVLSALESEIDRKRISQKISELFSLSSEEAADLVRSTPIILLDHLSKKIASQLKEYFSNFGANLILSKDTVFKRKCYRTVWPQPPSLAFLHVWEEPSEAHAVPKAEGEATQEPLHPEQALNEIRAMMHARILKKEMSGLPSKMEIPLSPPAPAVFADLESREASAAPPAPVSASEPVPEPEEPASELPPPVKELSVFSCQDVSSEAPPRPKWVEGPDLTGLREAMSSLESRHEGLHQEYQKSRGILEDQILSARQEGDILKKKLEQTADEYQRRLEDEKQKRAAEAEGSERAYRKLAEDYRDLMEEIRKDYRLLVTQSESFRISLEGLQGRIESVHAVWHQAQEGSADQARGMKRIEEKLEAIERRMPEGNVRQELEKHLQESEERWMRCWSERLGPALQEAVRQAALTEEGSKASSQVEARVTHLCQWAEKQNELLEKMLKYLLLSSVPPAEKGASVSSPGSPEPSEKVWNRTEHEKQLLARLADKEALLRRLVGEQEQIEKEIHDREDQMRRILTDQEKVEKEIIEVRQAQRQFALFDRVR